MSARRDQDMFCSVQIVRFTTYFRTSQNPLAPPEGQGENRPLVDFKEDFF